MICNVGTYITLYDRKAVAHVERGLSTCQNWFPGGLGRESSGRSNGNKNVV